MVSLRDAFLGQEQSDGITSYMYLCEVRYLMASCQGLLTDVRSSCTARFTGARIYVYGSDRGIISASYFAPAAGQWGMMPKVPDGGNEFVGATKKTLNAS